MGLYKQNYESKKLGIVLPKAYALIKELHINGEYGRAIFEIQTSRDNCFEKEPIERVELNTFKVNRDENPYVTAYKKMREGSIEEVINPETGEKETVESGMPFYKWQDDIIEK